jgi:hypothetical protein
MVTILEPKILEPKVDIPVESTPLSQELQPKTRSLEWRYAMPFAGVKYYSFRPVRAPVSEAAVKPLAVELIDERVILL